MREHYPQCVVDIIFSGIMQYNLQKLAQLFQVLVHVHPCHPLKQAKGDSSNA